jgi:tetratricopeptide (TPR) repeat protein
MVSRKAVALCALLAFFAVVVIGCSNKGPSASYEKTTKLKDKAHELQTKGKSTEAMADYTAAISGYTQFIEQNQDNRLVPYAKYNIAKCQQWMGKMDEAKKSYQEIISKASAAVSAGNAVAAKEWQEVAQWAQADLTYMRTLPAPAANTAVKAEAAPVNAAAGMMTNTAGGMMTTPSNAMPGNGARAPRNMARVPRNSK